MSETGLRSSSDIQFIRCKRKGRKKKEETSATTTVVYLRLDAAKDAAHKRKRKLVISSLSLVFLSVLPFGIDMKVVDVVVFFLFPFQ